MGVRHGSTRGPKLRFGNFEVDLDAKELRKNGLRVKLSGQAFDVLAELLERAGEVVTREQLQQKLWPSDALVDFDHGLNKTINRIREALCDSASSPRFLETLPRRGYRFIGKVEQILPLAGSVPDSAMTMPVPGSEDLPVTIGRRHIIWVSTGALVLAAVLAAVSVGVVFWNRALPPTVSLPATSVAVLPFLDLSPDPSDEYLSDGVTEEVIQSLALLEGLRVMSQTSSFAFKSKRLEAREIGSRLKVQYLVEGSLRKTRDQFRISAQLVRVADDSQIWSRTYEFPAGDLFAIEQGIARDVGNALRVRLAESSSSHTAVPQRRANNPEAYLSYLKGRYFWDRYEPSETWKALGYFEQAAALDPTYSPAYAGIAYCYQRLLGYEGSGGRLTAAEGYPKMKAAAERALEIDPLEAEAHAVLGNYYSRLHQWKESERSFQRALKINSSNALIRRWYAYGFLSTVGRFAEAIPEMQRSLELDPLSADSDAVFADILFQAGRNDEAVEWCRKALELNPDFPRAHWELGRVYLHTGNYAQGIQELLRSEKRMERESFSPWLGYAYGLAGQREKAVRVLERTLAARLPGIAAALIYIGLGEKERAFEQLQDMTNVDPYMPELASLRSDPRYAALLKRINLQ